MRVGRGESERSQGAGESGGKEARESSEKRKGNAPLATPKQASDIPAEIHAPELHTLQNLIGALKGQHSGGSKCGGGQNSSTRSDDCVGRACGRLLLSAARSCG